MIGCWDKEATLDDDDESDRKRYGGPITTGMIITALLCFNKRDVDPMADYDLDELTKCINGWLTPVDK
jgi:hypothetical protein